MVFWRILEVDVVSTMRSYEEMWEFPDDTRLELCEFWSRSLPCKKPVVMKQRLAARKPENSSNLRFFPAGEILLQLVKAWKTFHGLRTSSHGLPWLMISSLALFILFFARSNTSTTWFSDVVCHGESSTGQSNPSVTPNDWQWETPKIESFCPKKGDWEESWIYDACKVSTQFWFWNTIKKPCEARRATGETSTVLEKALMCLMNVFKKVIMLMTSLKKWQVHISLEDPSTVDKRDVADWKTLASIQKLQFWLDGGWIPCCHLDFTEATHPGK